MKNRHIVLHRLLFAMTALMITLCTVCMVFIGMPLGDTDIQDLLRSGKADFADTQHFSQMVMNKTYQIADRQRSIRQLEENGKLSMKKSVDVFTYSNQNGYAFAGEHLPGLRYTLEELQQWNRYREKLTPQKQKELPGGTENPILACQKPDYTYEYMDAITFLSRIREKEMTVSSAESGFLEDIGPSATEADKAAIRESKVELPSDPAALATFKTSDTPMPVYDKNGNQMYIDFWAIPDLYPVMFAPQGYDSLLSFINTNSELNGRLSEVFELLSYVMGQVDEDIERYEQGMMGLDEGNTNLHYIYLDMQTGRMDTNISAISGKDSALSYIEGIPRSEHTKYVLVRPKLADFDTNMKNIHASEYHSLLTGSPMPDSQVLAVAVDTSFPIRDDFYEEALSYRAVSRVFSPLLIVAIVSGILAVVGFIWLTIEAFSDRRVRQFDRWKTELALLSVGTVVYFLIIVLFRWPIAVGYEYGVRFDGVLGVLWYALSGLIGLAIVSVTGAGYLSLLRRIRRRTLWKNSLLCQMLVFLKKLWRNLPGIWRSVALIAGFAAADILLMGMLDGGAGIMFLPLLCLNIFAVYYVASTAMAGQKIRAGLERIAAGDLGNQIDKRHMHGDNWYMATLVNQLADGMNKAVEESVKNERLKTDLITNVSHDIKTPLTSIITYIMLLKREKFDDPKIAEYIDILEQKANRLKTLTEDVVEASKVSSGNVAVEMTRMNFVELLWQVNGEFEEKFQQENLELIPSLPTEPVIVEADGRHMWRVLANLYSNAVKYSAPGTRVYVELEKEGDTAWFIIKNTSGQQLNIPADELTERFIRGDLSRSTEGSGLGLAISKSLVQLMGGQLTIELDGDLFKVKVGMALAHKKENGGEA